MKTTKQEILFGNPIQSLDLKTFIFRCLRGWYWFVLFGGLAIATGWFYLKRQTPQYRISSKILVQKDAKNDLVGESLFGTASPFFAADLSLVNEVEILESIRLMERVIEALDINITYFVEGRFVTQELYDDSPVRLVMEDSTSVLTNKWLEVSQESEDSYKALLTGYDPIENERVVLDTISGQFGVTTYYNGQGFKLYKLSNFTELLTIKIDHPNAIAPVYAGRLDIQPVQQSEVLSIALVDNIAPRSIKIIYELIDVYNREVLDNKNRSTRQRLDFIDDRLQFITEELFEVEKDLEDFKRNNEVPLTLSTTAINFLERVNQTDQAISEIELKKSLLEGVSQELDKQVNQGQDFFLINFSIDGQVPEVIESYNRLVTQRKNMLISATENNPQVRALEEQIESTRKNLRSWIAFKQDEFDRRREYLESKTKPLNNRINSIPKNEREMLQIMRQQVIKETLFTFLLQRREETAMTLASEVSNARIINDPVFDSLISPNKRFIYLMFMFFGVSLPAFVFFFQDYFDNKIYTKEDIARVTGTPFMGAVNMARKDEVANLQNNTKSITAEMFRLLRSNLQFLSSGKDQRVLLVTSCSSGEGKTFVSFNLGLSLALSGKSVVLLGLDLRRPMLTTYIEGKKSVHGVSNYLAGAEQNLDNIINAVPGFDNFSYIGSGPIPPNPSELMIGERCHEMFDELKKRFDYIIADSSPIGLVADAFSLEKQIDTTLYITRFSVTRKADLQIVDDLHRNKKLPNPAIILNGVKPRAGYGYGYGGYAYRYGGYYQEDNLSRWGRFKARITRS